VYGRFAWRSLLACATGPAAEWPFVSQPGCTGPLAARPGGAGISWITGWLTASSVYFAVAAGTGRGTRHTATAAR
jgi:nucleobase:cation symporter-1, NCS1 family